MTGRRVNKDSRNDSAVSIILSSGETKALTAEAHRLGVTRSALIRGVLFGTYSVKNVLADTKSGGICIHRVSLTNEERRLIDEVAWEQELTITKLIRGIFYETV